MGKTTGISWSDSTWNPVRGCTEVSSGCANCYAKTFSERFRGVPGHPFEQGFDLRLVPAKLNWPLTIRKPSMIFVNSLSDLFHEGVPDDYILQVFDVMAKAHWHTFQVLTKRAERLEAFARRYFAEATEWRPGGLTEETRRVWPKNVWMGVSVENGEARVLKRIDHLRAVPAAVRFLSCEPLIGPLPIVSLVGIGWVIAGGESGPKARRMAAQWAVELAQQCAAGGVPFFFKQAGEVLAREWGLSDRKGGDLNEMPLPELRVQQMPNGFEVPGHAAV